MEDKDGGEKKGRRNRRIKSKKLMYKTGRRVERRRKGVESGGWRGKERKRNMAMERRRYGARAG